MTGRKKAPAARLVCPRCSQPVFYVIGSRMTRLGVSRTKQCSKCDLRVLTLEVAQIPGLRRAYRRLLRALGEQLPLPLGE